MYRWLNIGNVFKLANLTLWSQKLWKKLFLYNYIQYTFTGFCYRGLRCYATQSNRCKHTFLLDYFVTWTAYFCHCPRERIYSLETLNIFTKSHGDPSNSCQDILLWSISTFLVSHCYHSWTLSHHLHHHHFMAISYIVAKRGSYFTRPLFLFIHFPHKQCEVTHSWSTSIAWIDMILSWFNNHPIAKISDMVYHQQQAGPKDYTVKKLISQPAV